MEGKLVVAGVREKRERRGKGPCPFPRAGFQDEADLSQGKREDLKLNQSQSFNYYLGLGMCSSEVTLLFCNSKDFFFLLPEYDS